MLDLLPWYPRHVCRFPSKHIGVGTYEGDEHAFLFRVKVSPNLHGLGGVIEAEADLLDFLGLGGGARRLQLWDLHVISGHRLGFGDHASQLDGEVSGFSEGETLCLAGIGDGEVGPLGLDSYR